MKHLVLIREIPVLQPLSNEMKRCLKQIEEVLVRIDADDNIDSSAYSEIGIFDVESIKGLTVPVVITFYDGISDIENGWEKMQKLSHILVSVSRTQFGLFIVTKDFEKYHEITGMDEKFTSTISKDIHDDDSDAFRTMMLNMTTSEFLNLLYFYKRSIPLTVKQNGTGLSTKQNK